MRYEFFVAGEPKPQPRVRAYRLGNRAGVYDPGTAEDSNDYNALGGVVAVPISGISVRILCCCDVYDKWR